MPPAPTALRIAYGPSLVSGGRLTGDDFINLGNVGVMHSKCGMWRYTRKSGITEGFHAKIEESRI
jgi:hypothetical protein